MKKNIHRGLVVTLSFPILIILSFITPSLNASNSNLTTLFLQVHIYLISYLNFLIQIFLKTLLIKLRSLLLISWLFRMSSRQSRSSRIGIWRTLRFPSWICVRFGLGVLLGSSFGSGSVRVNGSSNGLRMKNKKWGLGKSSKMKRAILGPWLLKLVLWWVCLTRLKWRVRLSYWSVVITSFLYCCRYAFYLSLSKLLFFFN